VTYYVGILDGAKGVWGIRIPDVPGCYGAGASPEAAIEDAISALREVAAHQAGKRVTLRAPRSIQEIMADAEARYDGRAGESIVMVPLLLDRARSVKANISLDAGLLEAIDEAAKHYGLTRSSFIASASMDKIGRAESVPAATDDLRAELTAAHKRLARLAADFMAELRQVGGRRLGDKPDRPPRSKVARKHHPKAQRRSKASSSGKLSSSVRNSSPATDRS
jgi:predicted RNase H-like HicB family nuclease